MPDDIKSVSLYEQDYAAWAVKQAELLRVAHEAVAQAELHQANLPSVLRDLDWLDLAEEIESLARRDRRELASQITTIIEHLVKLQWSRATAARAGWVDTVEREREEVREIVRDSPSLGRELPEITARRVEVATRRTVRQLDRHGEQLSAAGGALSSNYTAEKVLGDWIPEPMLSRAPRRSRRTGA